MSSSAGSAGSCAKQAEAGLARGWPRRRARGFRASRAGRDGRGARRAFLRSGLRRASSRVDVRAAGAERERARLAELGPELLRLVVHRWQMRVDVLFDLLQLRLDLAGEHRRDVDADDAAERFHLAAARERERDLRRREAIIRPEPQRHRRRRVPFWRAARVTNAPFACLRVRVDVGVNDERVVLDRRREWRAIDGVVEMPGRTDRACPSHAREPRRDLPFELLRDRCELQIDLRDHARRVRRRGHGYGRRSGCRKWGRSRRQHTCIPAIVRRARSPLSVGPQQASPTKTTSARRINSLASAS